MILNYTIAIIMSIKINYKMRLWNEIGFDLNLGHMNVIDMKQYFQTNTI